MNDVAKNGLTLAAIGIMALAAPEYTVSDRLIRFWLRTGRRGVRIVHWLSMVTA